jgi:hypothetical protein
MDVPGTNRITDLEHRLALAPPRRRGATFHQRFHLLRAQRRRDFGRRRIGSAGFGFLSHPCLIAFAIVAGSRFS